jgi:hypothetical protein
MLILLDIDGVMVPAANWKAPELLSDGFPDFHPRAVRGLQKILNSTNAALLLTTSHKALFSTESWKRIFAKRGIYSSVFALPEAEQMQNRKDEITAWAALHPAEQNFVIIDDDKSLNDLPPLLKHKLVLTSSLVGLTDELADKAIDVLLKTTLQQA